MRDDVVMVNSCQEAYFAFDMYPDDRGPKLYFNKQCAYVLVTVRDLLVVTSIVHKYVHIYIHPIPDVWMFVHTCICTRNMFNISCKSVTNSFQSWASA